MAARIFAVLAALFLVSAVAIAAWTPVGLTLAQALLRFDSASLGWLRLHSVPWTWDWLEAPLLLRPLWLLPASIGVICAGMAMSFNLGKTSPSRHRRS